MKIKLKLNLQHIITFLMFINIIYYFIPITNSILNTNIMFLNNIGIFFLTFIDLKHVKMRNKSFVAIISLLILEFIFYFVRRYYQNGIVGIYSILYIFNPILVTIYLFERKEYQCIKFLAYTTLISLVFTSITTFIGLKQYPDLARVLATITDSQSSTLDYAKKNNIGGFDIVYSMVLAVPLYYYFINNNLKNNIIKLLLKIITFLLLLLFVIEAQYTTALLLVCSITVISIMIIKFNWKYIILLSLIFLLSFDVISIRLSKMVSNISDNIDSQVISLRLDELASTLNSGKTSGQDISERSDAYEKSIDIFKENVVTGCWYNDEVYPGGHSTILDTLAMSGIVIFIVIIICFYNIVGCLFFNITIEQVKKSQFLVLLTYLIFATLNPAFSGSFFSVLFITTIGISMDKHMQKKWEDSYEGNMVM